MTDLLLDYMKRNGIPVSRENYLDIAYGSDHETMTAEEEADLPEELQISNLTDFNPYHEPGGKPEGGQFASGEGTGITPELQARMDAAQKVADAIRTTDQDNSPARLAMRAHIADTLYNADIDSRSHGKTATFILGLPGAGKSTLANPLTKAGALEIDPDIAKTLIPEYQNGIGATAVHEESSAITREVLKKALTNGDDIVWPRVDGVQKFVRDVQALKALGYKVHVKLVDVSQQTSIKSVTDRFIKTGRLVTPETVRAYGNTPKESYNAVKTLGIADSMETYKRDQGGFRRVEG